ENNRVSLQVDPIAWEGCQQAFAIRLLDITEQSTIQERLNTVYSIFNTSPAVIFTWENKPGWPVIFVSDNVKNLLGYEPWDFLTGRIVYKELIHPQDLPPLLQDSFKDKGGATVPLARKSYRLIHAQGSILWVQEHVTGHTDSSGQITHYQGIIVDITAQKEFEQALGQSETRFRSVLDSAPFPIVLFGASDRVKYVNPSFTYLTGYEGASFSSSAELFQTLFPAFSLVKEIKAWNGKPAWDTNNHTSYDNLSILQDLTALSGETKHVTMIYGETANREHYLILHDNTEQIKAEQENKRLQEYVYQTQKMEAIGTLSAGVAHEFNNLLQGMKGSLEMIRFYNSTPVKYLESMDSNILKASELVKDLLNFSRHNDSQLESVNINNLIHSVHAAMEKKFPSDLSFDLQLDTELSQITADPKHIEHILFNLINNAREAIGDQKTGCITVRTQRLGSDDLSPNSDGQGTDQGRIKLEISDSGRGMEPWIVKQIFDPFFSTKDVGQGTGLGLSTVYGLVKSYSGSITCTSKPDAGTNFTLIFPATQDQVPDNQLSTVRRADDESHQTILLIDDEPLILETVEEILCQSGYKVWVADRAHKALDMLEVQAEECSLVILDLGLPEMSGEACLQKINNLHPDKPVIVSSGYLDHPIAHTPPAYGAKAFLAKPYSKNSLLSLVRNVLSTPIDTGLQT
ncbi:MAG: ATP-binding protein, partial [Desulfovermiculus sp.]